MNLPDKALLYGDNLEWLRKFDSESVDLVYLDPPFNSNVNYNVIFREHKTGTVPQAQITAFEDTWRWSKESAKSLDELITVHGELGELLDFQVRKLGHNPLSAYLVMMAIRLVELHRVLKPTGSLYLHCDPTASHYLKVILDLVFDARNFRNEIVWKRTSGHSDAKGFGSVHDVILFYRKSPEAIWNQTYQPYDPNYVEQYYRYKDPDGRRFMSDNLSAAGLSGGGYEYEWRGVTRVWRVPQARMEQLERDNLVYYTRNGIPRRKRYLDEAKGLRAQDLWSDIEALRSWHTERLGYPTQKPQALLERIIGASTNPGDLVLDPFCGCGTAVAAAEALGRRWVGIDITHLAVSLMKARMQSGFGLQSSVDFVVDGTPETVDAAQFLFESDPFQFQFWAVGLIGAQPYKAGRRGGDTGIDGLLYFRTPGGEKLEKAIVSVKGGKILNPAMIRDLVGVIEREKAGIGVFLSMAEPTRGMREEAAKAEMYRYGNEVVPRVQILTVPELLAGQKLELPQGALNVSLETRQAKSEDRPGETPLFTEAD